MDVLEETSKEKDVVEDEIYAAIITNQNLIHAGIALDAAKIINLMKKL